MFGLRTGSTFCVLMSQESGVVRANREVLDSFEIKGNLCSNCIFQLCGRAHERGDWLGVTASVSEVALMEECTMGFKGVCSAAGSRSSHHVITVHFWGRELAGRTDRAVQRSCSIVRPLEGGGGGGGGLVWLHVLFAKR